MAVRIDYVNILIVFLTLATAQPVLPLPCHRGLSVTTCMPAIRLKLTCLIISYYYPENQNKGVHHRHAQRLSHTFWHVYNSNRAWQELLRKVLVSTLPSSLSCLSHTHTQTDTVCSPSLHSHCAEVQDRLCANTLRMLRVRQPCLQSWALTMLRWGQVISASHVTHQSLLLSWCHCESMGTLITLFLHSTWNSLKEVVVFCVLTLKKLTNCGN